MNDDHLIRPRAQMNSDSTEMQITTDLANSALTLLEHMMLVKVREGDGLFGHVGGSGGRNQRSKFGVK